VNVGVGAGVREWITMNASQQAWVYFIDRSSILTSLPNLHPHPSQPNYPALRRTYQISQSDPMEDFLYS